MASEESLRLSQRIMELELENANLKQINYALNKDGALRRLQYKKKKDKKEEDIKYLLERELELDIDNDNVNSQEKEKCNMVANKSSLHQHDFDTSSKLLQQIHYKRKGISASIDRKKATGLDTLSSVFSRGFSKDSISVSSDSSLCCTDSPPSHHPVQTNCDGSPTLWVGSWNMGAVDPFSDSNGAIDEQKSSLLLASLLPIGYDLYVLGVQEGVSEFLYPAMEAYLNRHSSENVSYCRIPLTNADFVYPDKNNPDDATLDAVRGRGDKKFEHRGKIDITDPTWPTRVYRVQYKEPFYKGGQLKSRVPGWCDRILTYDLPGVSSTLTAHQVEEKGRITDNYVSINEGVGMDISDHSPVSCTFTLKLAGPTTQYPCRRSSYSMDKTMTSPNEGGWRTSERHFACFKTTLSVLQLHTVVLSVEGMTSSFVPKKIRVSTPLLGEDTKQNETCAERNVHPSTGTLSISSNVVLQHVSRLETLHLLIYIRHESMDGHGVISLQALQNNTSAKYIVPLRHHGTRVLYEGAKVSLEFHLRLAQ